LVIGQLEGKDVFVMQGRIHFYEGYTMAQVTLPVRVMQRLGIEIMIVTNAAGGIADAHRPGDVMLITDQINLPGMVGQSPLHGPNLEEFGPRFPDMTEAYDRELLDLARQAAAEAGVPFHEGVYFGLSGPSFETPAELRFLKMIGADAVGMSTVAEVAVARHGGTRVLGISGISNKAHTELANVASHEDVLEAGKRLVPKMEAIIRGVLRAI
jgi:purine-nucleoside phosphorylase